MKSTNAFSNNFLKFEKKHNLFFCQFSGVYIWDYIRYSVFLEIKNKKYKNPNAKTSLRSSPFKSVLALIKSLIRVVFQPKKHNLRLNKDITFLGHPRKVIEDASYSDKYCDDIIEELRNKFSISMFDLPFKLNHFNDRGIVEVKYLDLFEHTMIFSPYLIRLKFSKPEELLLRKIESEIQNEFQVSINVFDKVKKAVKQYKALKRKINKLFINNDLKCLVCVDGYNFIKKIFIESANERSIPTIELQHGAIGYFHIAYRYEVMEKELHSFPKYFFLWGSHWKNFLKLPKNKFSRIVGFPYLEKRHKSSSDPSKNILVISQWTIGFKLMKEVNKIAKELPEYHFLFKIHPNEIDSVDSYKSLIQVSNIEIVKEEVGLYDLFNKSVGQIGVYSTALLEGLAFNLKTFIIPIDRHEAFKDLIESNIMFKIRKADDILDKLKSNIEVRYSRDDIWKSDALKNNISEIKNIIML